MELTERQFLILHGAICPYCLQSSQYIDSAEIYGGVSFGMVYACLACKAWVGVHRMTDDALGRLANASLRSLKKETHKAFDRIWQSKTLSRSVAYKWLSLTLNIPQEYTHIGMFGERTCRIVIEICNHLTLNTCNN